MNTEYSDIKKMLNVVYYTLYVMYLFFVVIFGYVLKDAPKMPHYDPLTQPGQSIAYVVILYVLVSIPAVLWWFKKQMKAVSQIQDETAKRQRYVSCAIIRVSVIGIGGALAIMAFYILGAYQPMMWCAGIAILAQFFCKPSDRKIYLEINDKHEEDL